MEKETLEKVMKEKVEPILDSAMHKFLGVTINEVSEDISDKLQKSPLISYEIDTSLGYKAAKKLFRKEFLTRLLQSHYGNVSEVARITGLNRRSIHRDIQGLKINIKKTRKDMLSTKYYQKEAVDNIIKNTFHNYENIIIPERIKKVYENVEGISEDIVKELPAVEMTWDEAEKEFDKEYLKKILDKNDWNLTNTAKKIGLRYETLHRKLKKLNIHKNQSL